MRCSPAKDYASERLSASLVATCEVVAKQAGLLWDHFDQAPPDHPIDLVFVRGQLRQLAQEISSAEAARHALEGRLKKVLDKRTPKV